MACAGSTAWFATCASSLSRDSRRAATTLAVVTVSTASTPPGPASSGTWE